MMQRARQWITAGLPDGAYDALARGLSASRLWSLLLQIMEVRASARPLASLVEQWERDRFVRPAFIDQRTLLDVDRHLLASASAFEAIELSPIAPLGVCSAVGRASQNKILSALRGVELVADPTNVMALESTCRLRRDPAAVVRLATSHRCVRAQELPKVPGVSANFRIFCLTSAGLERADHAFTVSAVAEQVMVMLAALDDLERSGYAFPDRRITVFATRERTELADRIVSSLAPAGVTRALLDNPYYDGLRFQIAARTRDGSELTLIDGGTLDWLAKLVPNRKAVFVASGLGSQLVAYRFGRH